MNTTVIYGPPGTGKSTYLLEKISLEKRSTCVVSFTKAAAKELVSRAGDSTAHISTLHSLAFGMAGCSKDMVFGRANSKDLAKISGLKITGTNDLSNKIGAGDIFLSAISRSRASDNFDIKSFLASSMAATGIVTSVDGYKRFKKIYELYKKTFGLVDFDDMLERALEVEPPKFDVWFLDEAQDFTPLQWKLVHHVIQHSFDVWVAGDDDQSIYEFNGAIPSGMYQFERTMNADRVILGKSYRLPENIQKFAIKLINRIGDRVPKEYTPVSSGGVIERVYHPASIKIDLNEDTFILYRCHKHRQDMEDAIINRGLPYTIESGYPSLWDSDFGKAYRAVDHITKGNDFMTLPEKIKSVIRIHATGSTLNLLNDSKKLFGKSASNLMRGEIKLKRYMEKAVSNFTGKAPKITFSTIHASKGREADHVVVVNDMGSNSMNEIDSEIRVFYVAITRAKKKLTIMDCSGKEGLI